MRKNKVRFLLLLGVLILLLAAGLITFMLDNRNDETPFTEELVENTVIPLEEDSPPEVYNDILILGDSIGSGVGDEEMSGIGERYLELLDEEHDYEETITNLSVSGYVSSQLVELVESAEHNSSISDAELIIISIGGNDLNRLAFERDLNLPVAFEDTLNTYRENLEVIIREIRSLNQDSQLALIGLYNPYTNIVPELSSYLLDWNDETRLIVESDPGFVYIPTYDLFENRLDDYLYIDYFHPNDEGYQAIAEQLYTIVN